MLDRLREGELEETAPPRVYLRVYVLDVAAGRIALWRFWRQDIKDPAPPFHHRASRSGRSGPRRWRGGLL